jgi:tetratricopeptide (TPR) repeat protein
MSETKGKQGTNELKAVNDFIKNGDFESAVKVADNYLENLSYPPGYNAEKKEIAYYFADNEEFALFIEMNRDDIDEKKEEIESVIMIDGSASEVVQMKSYALFEMKKHKEAAAVLNFAIEEINPIGRDLRFELIENYFHLNQLDLAEKELLILRGLVMSNQNIARLYRRLGFCKIEQKDYVAARVCLQYSLWFEKSDMALHEIMYVDNCVGEPWSDDNFNEKLDFLTSGLGMGICSHLAHEMNLEFVPTPAQTACTISFLKLFEESGNTEMAEEYYLRLRFWNEIMQTAENYPDKEQDET